MGTLIHKVETDEAPKAIGPYSQATIAGDFMFVSGQIPIDPSTGKIVSGGITQQTIQVIDNIAAILRARGVGLDDVVKTEIYLRDLEDYKSVNQVYSSLFEHDPQPARQAMQVARLPMDAAIEMSCIAYLGR